MRSEKTPDYWRRTVKNDTVLREMTKGLYSVVDERSMPIAIMSTLQNQTSPDAS